MFCLELTNHCNLRCPMCTLGTMERPAGFMEPEVFRKVVDQSREMALPIEWFHVYGEPLLHPRIEEFMRYFQERGLGRGGISTNGLILNRHRIRVLTTHCREVLVAVDSLREEVYRVLRANARFQELCDKVRQLIEEASGTGLLITIQYLQTRLNPDESVADFERFFGRHDHVTYFTKTTEQFAGGQDFTLAHLPRLPKQNCPKLHHFMAILANGRCITCCYDVDAEQPIGSIYDNTLAELWQSGERRRQLRDSAAGDFLRLPLCAKCAGATAA
ncbi:MAG TPA: radical SAM protein [Thermoanaerobaculia bacterium]|nr:radical SAM protein [Thermoanaerobaculia bacterium]